MTSAPLIGAGGAAADAAAVGAVAEDGGVGVADAAGVADEADAGGGAAVAGAGAGAPAARASEATSAHAPGKSVAIGERAGRDTGESYRKSRGTSRGNYLCAEQ